MNPLRAIREWFFPPYMKKVESLSALVELLPVGDLDALCEWVSTFIPYSYDTDTGEKEGKYDKLQNYNGADLTIKAGHGDCESKAAVYSEVIRSWKGWKSGHCYFQFVNGRMERCAHDICWFITPAGKHGWIEGRPYFGDTTEMIEFYAGIGWKIDNIYEVNDIGERV